MSKLEQELVTAGFTKKLNFSSDGSVKIIVLRNTATNNQRFSLIGDLKQPTIKLTNQNPTIKSIPDGVRFHLSKILAG